MYPRQAGGLREILAGPWATAVRRGPGGPTGSSPSYFFEKKVPFHLDRATRLRHVDEIRPKRLIRTHTGRDMLDRVDGAPLTRQAEPA